MTDSGWTDERIATLKHLWMEGRAVTQIATLLGVTKGAVSGKLHREGITRPYVKRPRSEIRPRAPVTGKSRKRNGFKPDHSGSKPPLVFAPLPEMDIPLAQRCSLLELTAQTCRFPYGEPGKDLYFCGAVPVEDMPYCKFHKAICYGRFTP